MLSLHDWCIAFPPVNYYALTGTCTHTVCPALTLANGAVSYSDVGSGVERDVGSVATHTCNSGFRLEVNDAQAVGNTRTCSTTGWDGQDFMCGEYIKLVSMCTSNNN